jgi:hypothetical protein
MSGVQRLKAVSLLELDVNGDLIGWAFPAIDPETDAVIKARCGLANPDRTAPVGPAFRFSRFRNQWVYMAIAQVNNKKTKVDTISVTLLTQDFNPAKYKALLGVMTAMYVAENSPIPIMKAYLSVVTRDAVQSKHGNFKETDHDPRKALLAPVKKIMEMFGVEAVVVWVAMVLKKRVFVYSDKISDLTSLVQSFPLMGCWHRQNWGLLRPHMTLAEAEMKDLSSLGVYVAGFTDPSCASRTEYYDLFVDATKRSYTIADHAKPDFMMTKFHKQTGEAFMAACQAGNDQQVIKAIATKTQELITNIKSLQTEHDDGEYITLEELQQRKLPPNMATFLFNVASAEKLVKQ